MVLQPMIEMMSFAIVITLISYPAYGGVMYGEPLKWPLKEESQ